jgi:hypothetical protein
LQLDDVHWPDGQQWVEVAGGIVTGGFLCRYATPHCEVIDPEPTT